MLYVCVPSRNHGDTIGLLLWKVRQVFAAFPREYQFLVADDGSTDATREVLDLYERALPLTVLRQREPAGYGASLERLLREAVRRTDRPKRDAAITLPPDFSVSPDALPALVRRIESGADVVVGELDGAGAPWRLRLLRRTAPLLLRPGVSVPGVRDLFSGCYAVRLATLKRSFPDGERALETDGWCANAELVARSAAQARQISVFPVQAGRAPRRSPPLGAGALALAMLRAGRRLRIPAPTVAVERTA
jgi:glycosyltransferase involved in cell wall biosynthesis